jgi:IS605 OrfB family transposase
VWFFHPLEWRGNTATITIHDTIIRDNNRRGEVSMIKRYKYRAYPTPEQEDHLNRTFGCARVVYNDLISARETARANAQPYPSYVQLAKTLITEAKKTSEREWLREVSVTVLQQSLRDADKAYINFFRGIKSKKRIGSPRYKSSKARVIVAKAHKKVRETRLDHTHKLVKRVVSDNQVIALETLNIKGLVQTRLAKSVSDAAWGMLIRLFEEKVEYYDREIVRVSQWAPTSQTCSVCGSPGGKKPLNIRVWQCTECSTVLDYNAAVNVLLAAGLAERLNACGGNIRHELAHAVPDEARTLTNSFS